MPSTNISERGLETLIMEALTGQSAPAGVPSSATAELEPTYGGAGYVPGDARDYDRAHAVDWTKLLAFLQDTQSKVVEQLALGEDGPRRESFLGRLQGEIARRGVVDVLRKGVKHGPASVALFYGSPSPGNTRAAALHSANVFSITRQLRYSLDETQRALDLCLFINGLPVITFELKNRLTKQTVQDAILQYQRDRDPRELLFQFGRCAVHLAVDDQEVWMCTYLQGAQSWFLPFNRGWNEGAGNPPNPKGLKTDYLWREVLTREGLTDILENYAQLVQLEDPRTKKKSKRLIWPRYHQLDVVRKLLTEVSARGAGGRYLIEHSAGSGKSNSIAWLAHQLVGLQRRGHDIYDSIVVVTDRRVLDKQINDTIKQFAQVSAVVGHAERSGDLRGFIEAGKKIIITTLQKFPFVLDEISSEHRDRGFAIIIDEAHSSQGGRTAAKMNMVLSADGEEQEEETFEDAINRIMESRKMLPNASYFAFTATPKNKTLEMFGETYPEGAVIKHHPFHSYTMKQAIQEGFIVDVLQHYTPVASYYRLIKTVEDDPEYDVKKAQKKLRRYVEGHPEAIRQKAEVLVDHFLEQVVGRRKLGGEARAMVVTSRIAIAIAYYQAISGYLQKLKSPYRALVAFSGEHKEGGAPVTEATLNGFPSNQIPDKFREDPYRILVCAEKFQTGYDEPLLHSMYVDKILSGVKAVQTLSRLNRAHPHKRDTFVLDFVNDADTILAAFQPYYRTTILSAETDPNKLHDLKADLDNAQVYGEEQLHLLVQLYVNGAPRERLDPILDACASVYQQDLDEEGQVAFKGKAKTFVRTYNFLAMVLPYTNAEWEMLATFLTLLIPKLPAPVEEDLARGILDAVDMDSYRVEVKAALAVAPKDEVGTVGPVPISSLTHLPEPEIDVLSRIVQEFNELWGTRDWSDRDRVERVLTIELPAKVGADQAYQNARKNSDKQNARIEHDGALERAMLGYVQDHLDLYKLFSDNDDFRKWLTDKVFEMTYAAA
jgi:type I restriction enzyme R subunit